ncbi:MAG: hypothetical protein ABSD48_11490 [Armatimonadota bacterium]
MEAVQSLSQRVDLTQLGIWGQPVRVEFGGRYEDVWVQTLGDRTEAIERGHEAMQRKLLEFRPGSERLEVLTEALMLSPLADLVELALEGERPQMEARLRREMPDPVSPRQDVAAGEGEAEFARRVEEHRVRRQSLAEARAEKLQEGLDARRAELSAMERAELAQLARPRRIDAECWNAFALACDDWVLLRAVRRAEDHERQYFDSVEVVHALHPAVKEQLRRAYRALEPADTPSLPKG